MHAGLPVDPMAGSDSQREMYFGTGDAVPGDLTARAADARRARIESEPIGGLRDLSVNRRGRMTTES
jgi:hypothetical protein